MDVTVIGCGYVGLVTGTCLASIGHTVRGVEKDQKKLKTLQDGHCPVFEPGLLELTAVWQTGIAPVEESDIIHAEESAFEYVVAFFVFPVDPPGEVQH